MPFSFPASPSVGDTSTQNGRTYSWSGYAWEIVATPAALPASVITSGTLDIARIPTGTSSSTVCVGNDSRLSDSRTPTDGSVTTAKLADDAVTYAKLQNVSATDRLLGRSSSGAGDAEEITCTAFGRSLIDDADAATARTTLSVQPTASPAFTGAATFDNTGNVVPLTVTNTGTANSFVVNDESGDTTPFVINAAGNVGIGISLPLYKLHVSGGSAAVINGSADTYLFVGEGLASQQYGWMRWDATNNVLGVGADTAVSVEFVTSNVTRLTISSTGTATFAGQVLVAAGSVSACSVAPTGDPNTGLYFPSADVAALVTNGTERVRVGSGGRVQFFAADDKFGVQLNKGATGNGAFLGSDGADILTISTAGGAERVRVKATGAVRFVPLSADPSTGNEAGDVYYNSTTNKLKVYNGTSWVDLH